MNSQNKDGQEKGKEAEDSILALNDDSETAHKNNRSEKIKT